jgi:hypothetical protein
VKLDGVLESSGAEGYTTVAVVGGDTTQSPTSVTGHPTAGKLYAVHFVASR